MKFGYFNQLQMPKPWPENAEVQLYKDAMAEAVLAEEVGFEYYWQTEHHFYPEIGHSSAPELFLAALAQHTSKIRLGLGVVVLPCNHPFRVVEYVSTLDVLSGGRVELGTGRGASVYHSEAFGYDAEGAKELWDESIQIIASMFVDDPFPGWKGAHYDLPQRDLVPKPVQKPHPPMWLAATQPATFAKAARMGLGILGFSAIEPEKMIPAIRAYQDAMPECKPVGGFANHKIAAFAISNVAEDYAVGRDKACAAARWYFGDNDVPLQKLRFGSHGGKYYEEAAGGKRQGVLESVLNRSNDQLIEDGIVIGGDLDSTCRGVEKWMGLGVDQLLLMIQAGETSHDDTMRALDMFGNKVLPRFRD